MMCKRGPSLEQKYHWNEIFAQHTAFFGEESSDFAKRSLNLFRQEGVRSVLELGCGQGRDTLVFLQNDFAVTSLDYSKTAIAAIKKMVQETDLSFLSAPKPMM
jgi:cyclopropane fatty-acyl-phospholipid synthase-like methyltransferase